MKQLTHSGIQNEQRKFPITIVCDAIRTPENIGMCFRIAEGFGVSKIYLHEQSPSKKNRSVIRTARNTINQIESDTYQDFDSLLIQLKEEGNIIIGMERTDQSFDIQSYDFSPHKKITLLLGSERRGIQKLDLLDLSVAIPMYGINSSMNVVQSMGITLYEVTKQLRKHFDNIELKNEIKILE